MEIPDAFKHMNLPDLSPRDEIDLTEEEAEALKKSPRCPACGHLGIFHRGEWANEKKRIMRATCYFGHVCIGESV